ncbi:MAG: hypothetical protein LQ338_001486 [Usnochroma carphineum]|nr:MAG: hypothetical protein LQ338_001486 [Usnochroma carphineum]
MDRPDVEQQPQNLNTLLLRKLSAAVNGHAATATFACGGSVPILDEAAGTVVDPGKQDICLPVTLQCSRALLRDSSSITFPPPQWDSSYDERLEALLAMCDAATFGRGGEDVLDEGYRKASKLDTTRFSTNFHPHHCGILDSIQQVLLPSTVRGGLELNTGPQGVKAELYKLNADSDLMSTPLADLRSLVLSSYACLAVMKLQKAAIVIKSALQSPTEANVGGTLRVKHRGQTIDFNWANPNPCSIQWAAFYGDCEHEVLEVSAGHRVTLTYNLYYTWIGDPARLVHVPHQLPLYNIVRDMLQEPTFLQNGQSPPPLILLDATDSDTVLGGVLGFFCHHQYAHAHGSGRKGLPHALKGVDFAVYAVFHSLRLKVGVYPVIKNRSNRMGGMSVEKLLKGTPGVKKGDRVELFLEHLDKYTEKAEHKQPYERPDFTSVVGTALHGPTFDDYYEEESDEPVTNAWPHQKISKIVWMNDPLHQDFAHAGLAYGNQAELNYQFSAAAIIVVVPPSSDRISPPATSGALNVGRPPLEAYSTPSSEPPRYFPDNPGGDTAAFSVPPDAAGAGTDPIDLT